MARIYITGPDCTADTPMQAGQCTPPGRVLWGRPDQRLPRRDAFGAAGYTTRHDLSALARYLFLALIALVLFGIVAIFVQISAASSSTRSSCTRA